MTAVAGIPAPVSVARQVRQAFGVGSESPIPDLMRTIEDVAGIPVTLLPLPEGVAGAYGRDGDRHYIFVSSSTSPPRRRFTLAHELGHHSLEHIGMIDLDTDIDGEATRREQEANAFAAELLAPVQAVSNWMDARGHTTPTLEVLVRLACDFGLSAQSALFRLKATRYLTPGRRLNELQADVEAKRHLRAIDELDLPDFGDSLSLAKIARGAYRPSAVLQRDAVDVYRYGVLSLDEIGSALHRSPDAIAETFQARGIEQLPDDLDD